MLVITRKRSQFIRIGQDVTIKVIRTGKGAVKIGIDAPQDVRVLRGELIEFEEEAETEKTAMVGGDDDESPLARFRRERGDQSRLVC